MDKQLEKEENTEKILKISLTCRKESTEEVSKDAWICKRSDKEKEKKFAKEDDLPKNFKLVPA